MKTLKNSSRLTALVAVAILLIFVLAACQSAPAASTGKEPAKPSNPGGAGPAVGLTGDATKGAALFSTNCAACHGEKGVGGIPNAGATDPTVPALNPIDETMVNADAKVFATNIDLFIEHGSTPAGKSPALTMLPFGDSKTLSAQEIADVIAYVISLNKK